MELSVAYTGQQVQYQGVTCGVWVSTNLLGAKYQLLVAQCSPIGAESVADLRQRAVAHQQATHAPAARPAAAP